MDSGIDIDIDYTALDIQKPTVESILSTVKSGIGLDIAKNHTGICIWENNKVVLEGFELGHYDPSDYFAEYRLRAEFKNKLREVVGGKSFEFGIVEDVYGGDNFDTTRKLLALNTVIDELIFEGVCSVKNFVRWNATKWMSYFRKIYKTPVKLKSKLETQAILEYLNFDFYIRNKDLSNPEKEAIYFEDKCDATGMLCGMIMKYNLEKNLSKATPVKFSDLKLYYFEDLEEVYSCRDAKVREACLTPVKINTRAIESSIINAVRSSPNDVFCSYLPVAKLGTFGMKHKFKYYNSGEGYLIFYKKFR